MSRARSVAASVVALGLSGVVIGPSPAFAVSPFPAVVPPTSAAPTPGKAPAPNGPPACEQPEHYAAQSSAEFLRIDRLDLLASGKPASRQAISAGAASSGTTAPGTAEDGSPSRQRSGSPGSDRSGTVLSDVGLGDARSVVIADGPIKSAAAARTLNGKVTGSTQPGDMAIQKAPPVSPKADTRRIASKRFGPVQAGTGDLSARAVWAQGMACGKAVGDTSSASTGISRITIAGGGSAALIRVPEKITSRSGTALRLRGGVQQSVGSATISAGRISLVDNEVRLRLLRAPELRASMTVTGQSRVEYRPPVVEVVGRDGKRSRLSTIGDRIDITLSDDLRMLESVPPHLEPIGDPPLPRVSGLPALERMETVPAPAGGAASTLRITLGDVRQAARNNAVAARVTAIRVTVMRTVDERTPPGNGSSSDVVADMGIGALSAAAVTPAGRPSSSGGRSAPADVSGKASGSASGRRVNSGWGDASGRIAMNVGEPSGKELGGSGSRADRLQSSTGGDASRQGITSGGSGPSRRNLSGRETVSGEDDASGISRPGSTLGPESPGRGADPTSAAMPITGPRVVSLLIAGAALIGAGAAALRLASRRRKRS